VTAVLAPVAGRALAMADVPDPVFAQEMVGPGVAVDPTDDTVTVVAPVAGRLVKLLPHAFVVLTDDGVGVLVHLGIDTVKSDASVFTLLADEGATVAAGDPVVRWDVAATRAAGLSPVVPVVLMDQPKGSVPDPGDREVTAGAELYVAG
jgi:sugar PTS system EIIA component